MIKTLDTLSRLEQQEHTILIVDDNSANLTMITDYLKDCGFKTLTAINGERALQKAAHNHPDLILLDVVMPGIDGFETCRRLKSLEETKDIPVIFMTALTSTADKVKGFKVGAVDYVTSHFVKKKSWHVLPRICIFEI